MSRHEIHYTIPPGIKPSLCRGCSAPIYWLVMKSGKRMPVDGDGTPHWATCPKAPDFRARLAPARREEREDSEGEAMIQRELDGF